MKSTKSKGYFGFGVLDTSERYRTWEEMHGEPYYAYRREWAERPISYSYGDFPLSINVELTTRCNLACTFCTNPTLTKEQIFDIDKNLLNKVVSEAKAYSLPSVNLNGLGESLLVKELPDIIQSFKDAGVMDVMMHTNCTLLTKDLSVKLVEAGLDRLIFSVDSPSKKTYERMRLSRKKSSIEVSKASKEVYFNESLDLDVDSELWERTVANVLQFRAVRNWLKSETPLLRSTMILTEDTKNEVDYFYSFWNGLVDQITLQDLAWKTKILPRDGDNTTHWENKETSTLKTEVDTLIAEYKEQEKKFVCPYLYQSLWVHNDGTVIPCSNPHARTDMIMGDVKSSSINEIWHNSNYQELRDIHERGEWYNHPICCKCDKAHIEVANLLSEDVVSAASLAAG